MKSLICALALVSVSAFAAETTTPAAATPGHDAAATAAPGTKMEAKTETAGAMKMDCKHAKTPEEKTKCKAEMEKAHGTKH